MDHDENLIDLTYMLIAAESEMIWRSNGAYLLGKSTDHASEDVLGEPTYVCCQEKGRWKQVFPKSLKSPEDGRFKEYGCASGKIHYLTQLSSYSLILNTWCDKIAFECFAGSVKREEAWWKKQNESNHEEIDLDRMDLKIRFWA